MSLTVIYLECSYVLFSGHRTQMLWRSRKINKTIGGRICSSFRQHNVFGSCKYYPRNPLYLTQLFNEFLSLCVIISTLIKWSLNGLKISHNPQTNKIIKLNLKMATEFVMDPAKPPSICHVMRVHYSDSPSLSEKHFDNLLHAFLFHSLFHRQNETDYKKTKERF